MHPMFRTHALVQMTIYVFSAKPNASQLLAVARAPDCTLVCTELSADAEKKLPRAVTVQRVTGAISDAVFRMPFSPNDFVFVFRSDDEALQVTPDCVLETLRVLSVHNGQAYASFVDAVGQQPSTIGGLVWSGSRHWALAHSWASRSFATTAKMIQLDKELLQDLWDVKPHGALPSPGAVFWSALAIVSERRVFAPVPSLAACKIANMEVKPPGIPWEKLESMAAHGFTA